MFQLVKRLGLRYDHTNFLSKDNFEGKLECGSAQLNLFNILKVNVPLPAFVGHPLLELLFGAKIKIMKEG